MNNPDYLSDLLDQIGGSPSNINLPAKDVKNSKELQELVLKKLYGILLEEEITVEQAQMVKILESLFITLSHHKYKE